MLLDLVADTFGDRVALTEGGAHRTYDELRRLARVAAGELTATGAGTLAYADVSSAAVPTALFGAAWAGSVLRPPQLPAARRVPAPARWPGSTTPPWWPRRPWSPNCPTHRPPSGRRGSHRLTSTADARVPRR